MNLTRVMAIALRQYYLMRSSPTRVLPLFVWVAIDIIVWGFMTRYLANVAHGVDFVATLLGAVLLWDFFIRVMHGMTTAFLEDVWSRNFINVFASPLTIGEYLGGLVVTAIVTSILGLIVMLVLATGIFGLSFLDYGFAFIPFVLVLFLFGIALGILATAMVLRFGPASEWLVWPIPALLSPFAAVFYPLSTLPTWMQWIGHLLPPSYVFEGLRAIVAGQGVSAGTLVWGLLLSLAHIALAIWCFRVTFRHVVRTGLLARYSAEGTM
jgi:ABC-2 type transport system permease protein